MDTYILLTIILDLFMIYNELSEKPTPSGVGWIASPVGMIVKAIVEETLSFLIYCV